uniref:Uncharacterized protein n=1 Tax=Panagrolaimus davidi TaxID=227884 RepID=A0A914P0E9_9BILA
MGNVFSNSQPESTSLSDTSEQMPEFNNLFQEGISKMMRVTDDLHRMVDYISDLNNIMMIGLDLFIIIGILILIIGLAILIIIGILILIIGLGHLTIIGKLILLVLKRRNGKQERCGPQTPSPLPSESVKSEQNRPTTLIMNDDHTCIPNLQSTIPIPTTPTSMPYYSDPTAAAAYGAPPLTTSVSVAATPSVSSVINSEIYSTNDAIDRSNGLNAHIQTTLHHLTGNSQLAGAASHLSGQNFNSSTAGPPNGGAPLITSVSTAAAGTPSVSSLINSNNSNGLNAHIHGFTGNSQVAGAGSQQTTTFNQHTTNHIAGDNVLQVFFPLMDASFCCLDSSKLFDG